MNGHSTGVDPADRGLAYGDGLFETMAANDGVIRWFDLHLDRLEEGCRRLEIPAPSRSLLAHEIAAHCPREGRAVVKLIVTRGPGARGYLPPEPATPTRVLTISPWPDYPDSHYRSGISARVCQLRLGENPALAGIKHLCRLEQVLAQLELRGYAVQQGLLLDTSGHVVGGTGSNLFAVHGGELATPLLDRCGIKGVMRRAVLETARELGIRAAERDLALADVLAADELFVTNALFGIWPVTDIDGRPFAIGSTTRQLMARLEYSDAR
ncbi:MAG TPA: aminodeoxychorismate lyase [Gammaproteobacteria bacterium]|nr:aminodeoxychorismate lyase [Gammaproteobacteria bacterium]